MAKDYTTLITSQHIKRPNFRAMVALVGGAYGEIYDLIQSMPVLFDIDNAFGAQLDVIGQWVGRPRVVEQIVDVPFFGFQDDAAAQPFGELINVNIGARFYEQGEVFTSSSVLGDPEYRTILKAKIVRNQWDGSIAGLEAALQYVFGAECAVVDTGTLSLQITVGRPITAIEKTLLSTFDLLPRAAGVTIQTIQYKTFIRGDAVSTTTATGHL
jgi:hypothetical protein